MREYGSTFQRRHHPVLASAWTLRFVPGVIIGFAVKFWLDVVNGKDGRRDDDDSKKRRNKVVASKAAAAAQAAATKSDEEYKMVLCVNDSLKMGKGKIAAQCAHAAVGVVEEHKEHSRGEFEAWELKGHAKVALRVPTEKELRCSPSMVARHNDLWRCKGAARPGAQLDLAELAGDQGMFTYLVVDAGRTQIAAGSRTVLAIGPAPKAMIDKITGHLKLL